MSTVYNQIILIHNGALGDFLTTWPAIASLRRHYHQLPIYWAGRREYCIWLDALNIIPGSAPLQQAINSLYSVTSWPPILKNSQVIWFGLIRSPCVISDPRLCFISSIDENTWETPVVRQARQLTAFRITWFEDWLQHWRTIWGRLPKAQPEAKHVLLFPGAGHLAKQWPLERFIALATWLQENRCRISFVLGPAEREREMEIADFDCQYPSSLTGLQELIRESDGVIGNDSGPLHLAGYAGVKGVVLFGPTSALQWGPPDLRTVSTPLSCSPCTPSARVECSTVNCMAAIDIGDVQAAAATEILKP